MKKVLNVLTDSAFEPSVQSDALRHTILYVRTKASRACDYQFNIHFLIFLCINLVHSGELAKFALS